MSKYPDFDSLEDVKLPPQSNSAIKRQRITFFACFGVLVVLAILALCCAALLGNKMLAGFVFLILLFWLIITVIFIIRSKKSYR